MKVVLSRRADHDLLEIYRRLFAHNPQAAASFLEHVHRRFLHFSRFPFIGRERTTIAAGLRSALVGEHHIFYRVEADCIMIVRIIHGRMDIDEEFRR